MTEVRAVLVISGARWGDFPPGVKVFEMTFRQLSARIISEILPDLVIMPLFGPGFDAIEVLTQLERFGFRGDVIVSTPPLPNSRIVERELAAVVPSLHVRLSGPPS